MSGPLSNLGSLRARRLAWTALFGVLPACAGCVSSVAMHEAVLAYDKTADRVAAEQLLLNLARVRNHRTVHFTTISSIAATYNLEFTLGATPPLGGTSGGVVLSPLFGGSVAENPTVTIIPVEGEEFNQRVLTPMSETKFWMLAQQGVDLSLLLRMMAAEYRVDDRSGNDRLIRNRPRRTEEYEEFRRRVLHLAALHQNHELYVDRIVIEQQVRLTPEAGDQTATVLDALDRGYRWDSDASGGVLSRKMPGRLVMANYDLDQLDRDARRRLYLEASGLEDNAILVDVRPDGPGGDWAMHGSFRLRPFLAILNFLGHGIDEEPEFAVAPDPRSGAVRLNPDRTLAIHAGPAATDEAAWSVDFEGEFYAIAQAPGPEGIWNLEAFRLLKQLYDLSVHPSEFGRPAPAITIAK